MRVGAVGAGQRVWQSGRVTEPEPGEARVSQDVAADGDALAERLLAAHRAVAALTDSDVRVRLHLRFMAICTSLKLPGANRTRGAVRLDRLIADAERARSGNKGRLDDPERGN